MKILYKYQDCPSDAQGAVVAIGNFDGIHLGHQQIIKNTINLAKRKNAPSAIITFEPHPASILRPEQAPFRIYNAEEKASLLEEYKIDYLFSLEFNHSLLKVSANDFVDDILVKNLKVKGVVVGNDFIFGNGRSGNVYLLKKKSFQHGFEFVAINSHENGGVVYSSTKIREFIKSGHIERANEFLGRTYQISGQVETGLQRGRTIGFPTANINLNEHLRPKFGVYQVSANIDASGNWLPAIANVGKKPTFGNNQDVLEIYIFDFDDNIYNKRINIRFHEYIREEKKFDNIDSLKKQITSDCEIVRKLFNASK